MQMGRLSLYESQNIAGSQASERDAAFAKAVGEKTADEWHVVDDRWRSQGARFA
jgi:hypothetical protein